MTEQTRICIKVRPKHRRSANPYRMDVEGTIKVRPKVRIVLPMAPSHCSETMANMSDAFDYAIRHDVNYATAYAILDARKSTDVALSNPPFSGGK